MDQSLRQKAAFLYAQGVTTPEICLHLRLDFDTVMALLLPEPKAGKEVAAPPSTALKRSVGRPPVTLHHDEWEKVLYILATSASLWTLPQLAQLLTEVLPYPPSLDTLRRTLDRVGLSFATQVIALKRRGTSKRELFYVVTHRTTQQLGVHLSRPATLVIGFTPGNRVALAVRLQRRLSHKFLQEFMSGLSALHPNRRIVVAIS